MKQDDRKFLEEVKKEFRAEEAAREEPSYHQKQKEKERPDASSWSGASAGGGVWAGRTEHTR
ncbi:MAG: hypothetical protein WAL34_04295 [Acidobacteriaceae bacterium]